jgi:hypothetical protein
MEEFEMGWGYDKNKVRDQVGEMKDFWEQARGNQPASFKDLLGRRFRRPDGSEFHVDPLPEDHANYYLVNLAHLAESGLMTTSEFELIRGRIQQTEYRT